MTFRSWQRSCLYQLHLFYCFLQNMFIPLSLFCFQCIFVPLITLMQPIQDCWSWVPLFQDWHVFMMDKQFQIFSLRSRERSRFVFKRLFELSNRSTSAEWGFAAIVHAKKTGEAEQIHCCWCREVLRLTETDRECVKRDYKSTTHKTFTRSNTHLYTITIDARYLQQYQQPSNFSALQFSLHELQYSGQNNCHLFEVFPTKYWTSCCKFFLLTASISSNSRIF